MWAQHVSGGTGRFLGSRFDYPRVDVRHPKFTLTHYLCVSIIVGREGGLYAALQIDQKSIHPCLAVPVPMMQVRIMGMLIPQRLVAMN